MRRILLSFLVGLSVAAPGSANALAVLGTLTQESPVGSTIYPICAGCHAASDSVEVRVPVRLFQNGSYRVEYEVRPVSQAFTGTATCTDNYSASYPEDLVFQSYCRRTYATGAWKWRVRVMNTNGTDESGWAQFNAGLTGFVVGPDLQETPTSLDFGNRQIGASASLPVSLAAPWGDVTVTGLSASAPFSVTGVTLPATVTAATALTVPVTFAPTARGAVTGTLTVTSTAGRATFTLPLKGFGTAPKATLSVTALNFNNVPVGSTSTAKTFYVDNGGDAPLVVSALPITGPFQVVGTTSFTLAAGARQTLQLIASPTAPGLATGTLQVTSDSFPAPTAVSLSVTGTAPRLGLSPASLDLGTVLVGASSAPTKVTLSNTGTGATLNLTAITLAAPFHAAALSTTSLAPGASVDLLVTFQPTATGAAAGSLSIVSNDPASPATVPLSGTGAVASLSASPSPLDFGGRLAGATHTAALTLHNSGSAAIHLTALTLSGAQAAEFSLAPVTLPATVAAGGQLPLEVRFAPKALGARAATLSVASDAPGQPLLTVNLGGVAHGPRMAVLDSAVDFGSANVGSSAPDRSFRVRNDGDADLVVSSLALTGTAAADFSARDTFPVTIAPGTTRQLSVGFAPKAVGTRAGTATVTGNDLLAPPSAIALSGFGSSPAFSVQPTLLDFGDVPTGADRSQSLLLKNTGTGPLSISSVDLGGPDAARFSVPGVTLPLTVASGASTSIAVHFSPSAIGAVSARLTLLSDDPGHPSIVVPLAGRGTSAVVGTSPGALDFGGQPVGKPAQPKRVELVNSGNVALHLTALGFEGPQAGQFGWTNPSALPATVNAGASFPLDLGFTAAAAGPHTATLVLTTDVAGTPTVRVALSGLGLAGSLSATPSELDFGTRLVGSAERTLEITLSNQGGDALALAAATLTGPGAAEFSAEPAPASLAAGQSVRLAVRYRPSSVKDSVATLVFSPAAGTVPAVQVALRGKAVARTLDVQPTSLSFGRVLVGGSSVLKDVTFTNQSAAELHVTLLPAADPAFQQQADGLATLAPGASGRVHVRFQPTTAGAQASVVKLSVEGEPLEIPVDGEGVAVQSGADAGTSTAPDAGDDPTTGAPATGCGCQTTNAPPASVLVLGLLLVEARRRRRNAACPPVG